MLRRLLTSTLVLLVLAPPTQALAAGTWRWPVRGEVLTPYRNGDDPYAAGQHRGIDIAGAVGDPVVAAVSGEVRYAGALGSSGTVVSVRTADGTYDTSYLHLSSVAVARGQQVAAGDRLGAVGVTGERSAAAPHLHFGVREAGQRQAYLDPLSLLGPLGGGDSPQAAPVAQAAPAPHTAPAPSGQVAATPRLGGAPVRSRESAHARQRAWRPFRTPVAIPDGAGVRHPATRTAHAPAGSPLGAARPVSIPSGVAHGVVPHARRARIVTRDHHAAGHERSPAPGPTTALGRAPTRSGGALAAREHHRSPAAGEGRGADLGLVLACLSLAAAAIGLGLRGRASGGVAGRPAVARMRAWLTPLGGRG